MSDLGTGGQLGLFDQEVEGVETASQLLRYRSIFNALRSGVVILEPSGVDGDGALQVIAINQRGAEFFGSKTHGGDDAFDFAAL